MHKNLSGGSSRLPRVVMHSRGSRYHCQHASNMYPSIIVSAEDTGVFILCLAFQGQMGADIFIKCGIATRTRLIDIRKVINVLEQKVCEALLGMHAFTGCDSVSAFSGRGKVKALKLLMDNENFQDTFWQIGESWSLSPDILLSLEEITFNLYVSRTNIKCVNEMRYNLFRHKNGKIDSSQILPCKDSLQLHIIRANYQAAIWKRSLFCNPDLASPLESGGWIMSADNQIEVRWLSGPMAPDAVLEFLCLQLQE